LSSFLNQNLEVESQRELCLTRYSEEHIRFSEGIRQVRSGTNIGEVPVVMVSQVEDLEEELCFILIRQGKQLGEANIQREIGIAGIATSSSHRIISIGQAAITIQIAQLCSQTAVMES
jgi:hypothetical protein